MGAIHVNSVLERVVTIPVRRLLENGEPRLEIRQIGFNLPGELFEDAYRFVPPQDFTRERETQRDAILLPYDVLPGHPLPEVSLEPLAPAGVRL